MFVSPKYQHESAIGINVCPPSWTEENNTMSKTRDHFVSPKYQHESALGINVCPPSWTEENNTMSKTRDHFKKIGNKKRTCHARMGAVKETVKN